MPVPRPVFHAELGQFFAAIRENRGWTQRQATSIAERRGLVALARQTLWRLEAGKVKNPEPEVLRALSELYEVPYAELVARCVDAQYDLEVRPARPGEAKPEIRVEPALTAEEELLLGLYRTIPDKAVRREFLRMVAVAHAGLVAGGHASSSAAPRAAGEDEPRPRGKVLPIRRRRHAKRSP